MLADPKVLRALARAITAAGSAKAFADGIRMNPATISRVLNGHKQPGPRLLRALGFERVPTVRRIA